MAPTKQGPPVQFRDVELERQLDLRSHNRNYVARRDLTRYYSVLKREMESLRLLEEEEFLIAEACFGIEFNEDTARYIWAEVQDAMQSRGLGEKWQIHPDHLIGKLRHLTPGQAMALVDWTERWHRDPNLSQSEREAIAGGPRNSHREEHVEVPRS